VHPADREATKAQIRYIRQGQTTRSFENRLLRKDGGVVHLLWSLVWSESEQCFFATGRDISERLAAEERLRHAQKMEALGQLTGGIAHDFNNLLTIVLGNSELLAEALTQYPKLRALAEMIRESADRGAALTSHLLAFARRQPLAPRKVDLNELIANLSDLLRRTLGEHIQIEFSKPRDLWPARIDPMQMESALLNLAINARDAMPGGGRLLIETGNVLLEETSADLQQELPDGRYVLLTVSDSGSGMVLEVARKAFEPFFTTKGPGRGSGLGLSMVYGFVKQSGGHVKLYSEPGHGTAVRLYLPCATEADSWQPQAPLLGAPQGGDESILLVEDDPQVRANAEQMLRSLGYRVQAASNAHDALGLLGAGLRVDLLFTDIIMPGGLDGQQLAETCRRLYPKLKILFTSGYSENALAFSASANAIQLLSKPYRRRDLAAKIRAALDSDLDARL
jgi:signal transduction histidine kinase/ActR/RegA family two-component response regulator